MKYNLRNKSFYALLAILFIFTSCSDDDTVPVTGSVLILHQGNFGSLNATVGSYDPESKNYNPSAYRDANGDFIGDVLQSAEKLNGQIYGVLNGTNAIQAFDAETFLEGDIITDDRMVNPRYIVISGNTAYVSNSGPYQNGTLVDSNVLVVDLQSKTVTAVIETGEDVENVFLQNNKLLVSRTNWDGSVNNLTIINTDTKQVIDDLEMPAGPAEIIADANGNVWIVCKSGKLVRLNNDLTSIEETVDLSDPVLGDIDMYGNEIYFYQKASEAVKKLNVNNATITIAVANVALAIPYALGVDPNSGEVYLGDQVDYTGEGSVLRFSADGEPLDDFVSGLYPEQFIFN